uniref:TSPO associated protein 1 n=1 Tax=Myripristis murdjan TaxID=586833 RepID=A0A667ZQH7_9TELE
MRKDRANPLPLSSKKPCQGQTDHGRELERLRADLEAEKNRRQQARRDFCVELRHLREEAEREQQRALRELTARHECQKGTVRRPDTRQLWLAKKVNTTDSGLHSKVETAGKDAVRLGRGETYQNLEQLLLTLYEKINGEQAVYKLHHRQELELEKAFFLCHLLEAHRRLLKGGQRAGHLSHTLMLVEKAWLSVSALIHPKGVLSGSGQDSVQASQVHPHQTLSSMSLWTLLCALVHSHVGRGRGPAPNCSHKVGSMELSKMFWYPEAFKVPFTGTKGPSPAPEKQPHTIIPPPPNFTVGTMQSEMYRSPGNLQTQTRPSDCQMEKRDSSLQRTRLHCSRGQWRRALHHCIRQTEEKVRRLRRKNTELAVLAKRLEERARKLQEANLKVVNTPSLLRPGSVEQYKRAFARQRARDLAQHADTLLSKDKEIAALQQECRELEARLGTAKVSTTQGSPVPSGRLEFERLLRESQREVLRLQRQLSVTSSREQHNHSQGNGGPEECGEIKNDHGEEKVPLRTLSVSPDMTTQPSSTLTPIGDERVDTASEVEELDIDVAPAPYTASRGAAKLQVFIARYSYNPYDGPNDNPEVELPLTAGEYIYVYGDMDDDGFYEGELMDGRRGLVPSNFVERQPPQCQPPLAKSIIIGWDPPLVPAGWGNVWSYNVYVDQELRLNVPFGSQTKAVLERLDINLKAYRVSVQSLTEKGLSDQLRCSMLVGRDVCVAPTQLRVDRITATSANLSWLASNSNYVHIVSLNEEECELVKAGCYSLCLNNLLPSLQYTVKVEARPHRTPWELPVERREHKSTNITFTTLMAGPPDAPLDVQLEHGPSPGIALISWLPVTIDAAGISNGVRVTGYTIYADKKKVLEVSSPTAGSALLGPSQIQSLQTAQELTVRTMSAHGESCDSLPVNVPSKLGAIMAGPAATVPVVPAVPCTPINPNILPSSPSYGNSAAKVSMLPHTLPSDPHAIGLTVETSANPTHTLHSEALLSSASYVEAWANPSSAAALAVCEATLPAASTITQSQKTIGNNDIRLFVALFPYDPATMSPNPDAAEEELPFSEGQIIKVYGDKDADGFYRGESGNQLGYVPCNMVSEIQVEDEETRQQLLQQGFLSTAASMEKIGL